MNGLDRLYEYRLIVSALIFKLVSAILEFALCRFGVTPISDGPDAFVSAHLRRRDQHKLVAVNTGRG